MYNSPVEYTGIIFIIDNKLSKVPKDCSVTITGKLIYSVTSEIIAKGVYVHTGLL